MPAKPSLSRATSNTSVESAKSQNEAALRGALLAFSHPVANARIAKNSSIATLYRPAQPVPPSATGGSHSGSPSNAADGAAAPGTGAIHGARLPLPTRQGLVRSPSHHAALVANARVPPLALDKDKTGNGSNGSDGSNGTSMRVAATRTPAVPPKPRTLSSHGKIADRAVLDRPTDTTSIPPTTSLISMFEQKTSIESSPTTTSESNAVRLRGNSLAAPPKSTKVSSGITTMIQIENTRQPSAQDARGSFTNANPLDRRKSGDSRVVDDARLPGNTAAAMPPPLPAPRKQAAKVEATRQSSIHANISDPSRGRTGPSPAPPLDTETKPIPIARGSNPSRSTSAVFPPLSAGATSIPAQWKLLHPKKMTPHMTGDQLADAMVAGSLASSRQASPTRSMLEPPSLPRRHKSHNFSISRLPSPAKAGMKKTLRQAQTDESDDEDEQHLHTSSKRIMQKRFGKHPNKHHEGDRKRWRESITESEWKRYAGVWAANKGFLCAFTLQEQKSLSANTDLQQAGEMRDSITEQISNVVAREVWSRSRLADNVSRPSGILWTAMVWVV